MRCPIRCSVCEENKWTNIDKYRLKKTGMCICESCGFISWPNKYKSEKEIRDFYKSDYRPAPVASALFTGERKLQYHATFLKPLFEEWDKKGLRAPVIGEIGSAYGMLLNWLKSQFKDADINGVELTESYRRVAFHEYGLRLEEDFNFDKKYDLIISYHTHEHIMDSDLHLKKCRDSLKDDGIMYFACPVWFRELNSGGGMSGFEIEEYWHPNHINAWSEEHLEWIFKKCGLKIETKNDSVYGNTYILKKSYIAKKEDMPKFNAEKYLESVQKIYNSWYLLKQNKTAEAIESWPNCPAAWITHYELNRADLHKDQNARWDFLNKFVDVCKNSAESLMFYGDVLTRYERYDEAYSAFSAALEKKPHGPVILIGMANCLRMKAERTKDVKLKTEFLTKAINLLRHVLVVSTEMTPQAISWIYQNESLLPIPELSS